MQGKRLLLALGCAVAIACSGGGETRLAEHAAGEHAGPEWYRGTVEEAFLLAKQHNRPLFLYWGAEWCPPCHALKTRVFRDPRFIEKMRDFVPVYLDADTEHAQTLGERLGVDSYPTVVLFTPDGREIMRMPSEVSVERYVELLDTALGQMRPIEEVLAQVRAQGAAAAPPRDLDLLAFYSWEQDDKVGLDPAELVATFRELYRDTPQALGPTRSRFLTQYVESASRQKRTDDAFELTADERSRLHDAVTGLLDDPRLREANLPFVFYSCRSTVELLHPAPSPGRHALIETWDRALSALEQDETLSLDERLTALSPRLDLARLRSGSDDADAPLPDSLLQEVRDRVRQAADQITDESELQAVMNTMAHLLEDAGLSSEAEELLQDKLDDAHAPYYFMGWMASLKRDAAQTDEALTWYRRAYDSSRGRYSRFRWGSIYLRARLDLSPDDEQTIEHDSREVLTELLGFDDAFAGGNRMRLRQLETAYRDWNSDGRHAAPLARIRELVLAECGRFPAEGEDSPRDRCESFLAADAEPA